MKIKHYLAAILISISSTSCEDFLSTEPTNFVTPTYKTISELETGLSGVYDVLGSRMFYGDNWPFFLNVGTDLGASRYGSQDITAYVITPGDRYVTEFWKTLYQGIFRANLVLARVDNPELNEARRNEIKGQALFLRAYYYFMLVSNFGDVPLLLTDKPNIDDVDVPRTSSREIYQMIVRDMEQAEQLVPDVTEVAGGGRVTASAVQGILARVHLTMAGYPLHIEESYAEALKWARKVRDKGFHRLNPDFKEVFINYAQNRYDIKESIWEVEFYGRISDNSSEFNYFIARAGLFSESVELGFNGGAIRASKYLWQLYEQDPNSTATPATPPATLPVPPASLDLRRDWTIAPYAIRANGQKVQENDVLRKAMAKWRREYEAPGMDRTVSDQNFPILRYSDVLLMIAEAANEVNNGPTPEAFEAINEVRRRAYGLMLPTPPNPGVSADLEGAAYDTYTEFFQAIKEERARELAFEALRRPDLIRWGILVERLKDYKTWLMGEPGYAAGFVLAPTNVAPNHVLLPIPTADLSLNKKLTQNPGY